MFASFLWGVIKDAHAQPDEVIHRRGVGGPWAHGLCHREASVCGPPSVHQRRSSPDLTPLGFYGGVLTQAWSTLNSISCPPPFPGVRGGRTENSKLLITLGLPRWCQWKRARLPVQKMRETWIQSLGWKDPLEVGMATHSSILAWRIPWTEEPGGLQSTGSQRGGHNTAEQTHIIMAWSSGWPAPIQKPPKVTSLEQKMLPVLSSPRNLLEF